MSLWQCNTHWETEYTNGQITGPQNSDLKTLQQPVQKAKPQQKTHINLGQVLCIQSYFIRLIYKIFKNEWNVQQWERN